MARMPEGPPPPPTVQKLRIRYAKRGRLRFTSHRDIQRAFERALRRARVPMAYSAGFTPHPKVSWAGAAPTGVASEAEYVEIGVTRALVPAELAAALDGSLPPDLDILEVVEAATPNLMERLEASVWEIRLPGVLPEEAEGAVTAFLAAGEVPVERMTKNGVRSFDARAAVVAIAADAAGGGVSAGEGVGGEGDGQADRPCAILRLVVRHLTPAVRPDDVLTGLGRVAGLVPPVPPQVTRLAQGPLRVGSEAAAASVSVEALSDPLDPDRAAAGPTTER
ncbi:TIGR03936 family radical SAM-associated protein [Catenulispora subtropica]|uniref:TIGR03936 family radical SAM-associated protein n=2 Tax=Catenulispora subtropica TaxID=450798 RepID=A0ABN2S0K6_9ACTN